MASMVEHFYVDDGDIDVDGDGENAFAFYGIYALPLVKHFHVGCIDVYG